MKLVSSHVLFTLSKGIAVVTPLMSRVSFCVTFMPHIKREDEEIFITKTID
jgi:hypothetical protein